MLLVYRETGKGIFLAEQSSDETSMQLALERDDPRLILTWEIDPLHQARVYKVLARISDDRPAQHVCDWRDDYGVPLPLSSGLVDKVKSLRPENRGKRVDADEHNARLTAKRRADFEAEVDGISHENRKKLWRGPNDPHDVGGQYSMHRITKRFGAK